MRRRTRSEMAELAARDIPRGAYVNLGIGMPTLIAQHLRPQDDILVHSEKGLIGLRPLRADEPRDVDLTNAAKAAVGILPGGAYFDILTSFTMMRGGHLDLCVLGAFQVSCTGDLANWSLEKPGLAPAVGGAMDLVAGARRVVVLMEHTTPEGRPKLLRRCTLPLTGQGVVKRVYTDLATLDITPQGFVVIDMVRDLRREDLQALTDAPLQFLPDTA